MDVSRGPPVDWHKPLNIHMATKQNCAASEKSDILARLGASPDDDEDDDYDDYDDHNNDDDDRDDDDRRH